MKAFIGVLIIGWICGAYSASLAVLSASPCDNYLDGDLLPIPGDCSNFYICFNNQAVPMSCGEGVHFDPEVRLCVPEQFSKCEPAGALIAAEEDAVPEPVDEPVAEPEAQLEAKPETQPEAKPEEEPEEVVISKNMCTGKAIGAFLPSHTSCSEFYVCVGTNPMLKTCPEGLSFNPDTRSCTLPELSNCVLNAEQPVEAEEVIIEAEHKPVVHVHTTIFAETVCRGQANGAMFPVAGSCSKYFACLQEIAFEQTCGLRHFDPLSRSCIAAHDSKCVEGEVSGDLKVVIKAVEVPVEEEKVEISVQSIGDTNLGTNNDGVFIGNANIDVANTGYVSAVNLVSGSSNIITSNTDLGSNNKYEVNVTANSSQAQVGVLESNNVEPQNVSIGDTNLGANNSGIFIGNANLSINNTGTVSNTNIVTASKDVIVSNTDLGYSNSYTVSGGKLIGNNKSIPLKQTGLPVNKKHIDTLTVGVSNAGLTIETEGTADIGNADLGQSNQGIFIGNANVNISNSGSVSDVNIVSGSQSVIIANTDLGDFNAVVVAEQPKENKEVVFAKIDEQSSESCVGVPSGTLLPRAGNCREFLTCESGIAFVGVCPRDLHFNPIAKFCDWPEMAGCAI